ncbi:MAG: class II aldolase/adducin family protein [Bacteroidales bacterium]|jgi:L-ribulose-5-phosphate 4-epimerase|nr:class II aldolase/adducin family protein [Bacteroidales bacterium]
MNKSDEGYIKFNLSWGKKAFDFKDRDFIQINSCRDKLYKLGLIGAYSDGIGFGNISIRQIRNEFIISGSASGNIKNLLKKHYSLIKDYDILKNNVLCEGLTKASSESLTHAAIYESNKEVNAVIHVHHKNMWNKYLNNLPTTCEKAEFGTPEIALEIQKLINKNRGIIIMAGHPEGIVSYGESLVKAEEILLKYFRKL